jgi:hypothetical protein
MPKLYIDGPASRYYYCGGWNPIALAAFAPSAVVSLVLAMVPAFLPAAPLLLVRGSGARRRPVPAPRPAQSGDVSVGGSPPVRRQLA